MSNIDKHAVQAVADLKAGYTLGHADVAILNELARIALASLEAEAVAYIFKHPAGRLFWSLTDESNKGQSDVLPVYTAPPAPVSEREPVQMFGIGSVFKPQILSGVEVDCDNCAHYQPNVCHGEGCPAAMLQGDDEKPELTVWYGSMPESNGKSNWTAILHRKGEGPCMDGFTIDRSEYPGRVLYAADRVRYLIGEKSERPSILDYDADAHSGYVKTGNSPVIPAGYALVPVEPTYQMCEAMGLQWESPRFPDRYKAMLAAVKK